jgi:hypothetical protein
MQDFWLLNGFFLAIGLIHILISLIIILSDSSYNLRNSNGLVQTKLTNSRKAVSYNLLVTGLIISLTAALILILAQSTNLLVVAAINLAVTFIALRLHLFHDAEIVPMLTIRTNEADKLIENTTKLNREAGIENIANAALNADHTESIAIVAPQSPTRKPYVEISPELFAELTEISSNPTAAVDEAIRWWLRRRLVVEHDSPNRKSLRSSESWRSQQSQWND